MRSTDAELITIAGRIGRGATALAGRARAERAGVLTLTETAVLGRLRVGSEMTPRELADRLRMQPQSLTRTLASLEQADRVRRTRDPRDGRQALLAVTQAGALALAEEMHPRNVWLAGVIEHELSVAERDLLVVAASLMERLALVDASPAVEEMSFEHGPIAEKLIAEESIGKESIGKKVVPVS
jgi:DNA-binding MarR family transcriptional regulator